MLKYAVPFIAALNIAYSFDFNHESFKTKFNYKTLIDGVRITSKFNNERQEAEQKLENGIIKNQYGKTLEDKFTPSFNPKSNQSYASEFKTLSPTINFLDDYKSVDQLVQDTKNPFLHKQKLRQAYVEFHKDIQAAEKRYTGQKVMGVYQHRLNDVLDAVAAVETWSELSQYDLKNVARSNGLDQKQFEKLNYIIEHGIKPIYSKLKQLSAEEFAKCVVTIPAVQIAESGTVSDHITKEPFNVVDNDGGINGLSVYETGLIARFGFLRIIEEITYQAFGDKKINGKTFAQANRDYMNTRRGFVPIHKMGKVVRDASTLEHKLMMGELVHNRQIGKWNKPAVKFYQQLMQNWEFRKKAHHYDELVQDLYGIGSMRELFNMDAVTLSQMGRQRRLKHEEENPAASPEVCTLLTLYDILHSSDFSKGILPVYMEWNLGKGTSNRVQKYINDYLQFAQGTGSKHALQKSWNRMTVMGGEKVINKRIKSTQRNFAIRAFNMITEYIKRKFSK